VVYTSRGPSFPQSPFPANSIVLCIQSVDAHFLYGDGAVQDLVVRTPHPPHAALAYRFPQPVTTGDQ
jgi:hypothetical protein